MANMTCTKCSAVKDESDFYMDRSRNRRQPYCRDCSKKAAQAWRDANRERVRAYSREHRLLPHKLEADRKYKAANRAASIPAIAAWKSKYPERATAHRLVGEAVTAGRLARPTVCEACGAAGRIHGHHDDYSRPLDVRWLCPPCHGRRHRELNAEQRAAAGS